MITILLLTLTEEDRNRVLSLWQEYSDALLHYVRKELGPSFPAGEAEDVVSDAFERLMVRFERYAGLKDEQMKSLLLRTAKNLCVDAYRRRKHRSDPLAEPDPNGEEQGNSYPDPAGRTPEELVVSEDNVRRMNAMIRSLSPVLRDVLEMRLIEDMTNREIAEELGIPETVVRQRFSRARKTLKARWEEEEHG